MVFDDEEGNYIQNKKTGAKMEVIKIGGVYRLSMWMEVPCGKEGGEVGNVRGGGFRGLDEDLI